MQEGLPQEDMLLKNGRVVGDVLVHAGTGNSSVYRIINSTAKRSKCRDLCERNDPLDYCDFLGLTRWQQVIGMLRLTGGTKTQSVQKAQMTFRITKYIQPKSQRGV